MHNGGVFACQGEVAQFSCRSASATMSQSLIGGFQLLRYRNNRVAFCDTVLERNRRCRLPEADNNVDHGQSSDNVLDTPFPFEPYQLTR